MPPRSSSGWVPTRGWFYALAGLVIVESVCLATVLWRRTNPAAGTLALVPSAQRTGLPPASSTPLPLALPPEEDETPPAPLGRDPLARALHTRSRLRRIHRLEDLGASLAKQDLPSALQILPGLSLADGSALVRGLFDTLGHGNRHLAVATAAKVTNDPERAAALQALLSAWQGGELAGPYRFDLDVWPTAEANLGMNLVTREPLDVDLVLQWAQTLTQGTDRAALLGGLAGTLARTDPARAMTYGADLNSDEKRAFNNALIRSIPESWIKDQPQQALAWSQTLTDPDLRDTIEGNVFDHWGRQDAPTATQAALALPPGRARENALDTVASNLAQRNTAAADALAQSLSGRDREVVDAAIGAQTPVGIGAALQMNDGVPVVSALVDNMPAVLSGQIHPGDRIVGIVRPDGVLVKTADLDLGQVVNLIRGAPASTVQLQVAPAQSGGGFAPVTTISLIRQRITHG